MTLLFFSVLALAIALHRSRIRSRELGGAHRAVPHLERTPAGTVRLVLRPADEAECAAAGRGPYGCAGGPFSSIRLPAGSRT